jgi:hypothetical protein
MAKASLNRADKATVEKRVRAVMDYLMQGYQTKDIIAYCISKFDIDERMAYKYHKKAFEEFKLLSNQDIEERRALAISMRYKLFNELEGKTTPAGASVAEGILSGIEKIQGLHVHKIEHDVKITKIKVTRK